MRCGKVAHAGGDFAVFYRSCDPQPATNDTSPGFEGACGFAAPRERRWLLRDDSTMVLLGLPQPIRTLVWR